MSESSQSPASQSGSPEGRAGFWWTFLAIAGCFLIFVVVLVLAYVPLRRQADEVDLAKIPAEEQWKFTAKGRQDHLDEMRARERAAATSYAWIDKGKGVVQLPIDRAMELTLQKISAERKR
jgi:hypothetical protein